MVSNVASKFDIKFKIVSWNFGYVVVVSELVTMSVTGISNRLAVLQCCRCPSCAVRLICLNQLEIWGFFKRFAAIH